MVSTFRKLARRFGFDISPFPGSAPHWERLIKTLSIHNIDCVFDIGANTGQYAQAIRTNGYAGEIVSFEPLSGVRATLEEHAARDPHWTIAPQTAVGAEIGQVEINISGESDMSSILALDAMAHERLASTRATTREQVPVTTLSSILEAHTSGAQTIFVKSDTQGYEDQVLDGDAECPGTASPGCSSSSPCSPSTTVSPTICRCSTSRRDRISATSRHPRLLEPPLWPDARIRRGVFPG